MNRNRIVRPPTDKASRLGLHIRYARADDIPAMTQLLQQLFAIEKDFTPDPERQVEGLRLLLEDRKSAILFVAEAEGRVVGMCSLLLVTSTAEGGRVGWNLLLCCGATPTLPSCSYTASCTCHNPNPRKERTRQQEEPDNQHKRRCQRRHPERLQRCRHCREYHGRQHHSKRCVCRRGGVQDKKAATKRNGGKNRVEAKGTGANRGLGSTHTPRYEQSDE